MDGGPSCSKCNLASGDFVVSSSIGALVSGCLELSSDGYFTTPKTTANYAVTILATPTGAVAGPVSTSSGGATHQSHENIGTVLSQEPDFPDRFPTLFLFI